MTLYTLRKYNLIELDLAYKMAIFDSTMQLGGTSLCARSYLEHRCLLYFFPLLINLFSSVPLHDTLLTIFFLKLLFTIPRIFIISKLSVLQFFSWPEAVEETLKILLCCFSEAVKFFSMKM